MHPIKSIEARIQRYTLSHFKNSNYARKLRKFKDIHRGESCFIVGNGPSLRAEDLEILHKKNIPCFAFNRIYLMFDKTNWRPKYYISQDEKTLFNCQKEVNNLDLEYKFIPLFHKYFCNIEIDNAFYFFLEKTKTELPVFSEDISVSIGDSTTVAYTAAQFAVYMGFTKIYLIGVDHNFSVFQNANGEIVKDETVRDYFTREYNKDKDELYIPRLDESTKAYVALKNYSRNGKVKVYNATRGGKLEVFPRICFDDLFK